MKAFLGLLILTGLMAAFSYKLDDRRKGPTPVKCKLALSSLEIFRRPFANRNKSLTLKE